MSHILISFLGKVSSNSKDGGSYKTIPYRFSKGRDDKDYKKDSKDKEYNFFGLALLEHLKKQGSMPDKFVVFGTTGSMWDTFFEMNDELKSRYSDKYEELWDLVNDEDTQPTEEQLKPYLDILQGELEKHEYLGIPCEFRFIPYGETESEQIEILRKMTEVVKKDEHVSLDITHGLRHLPMLVVLSAMYLEAVKGVTIKGIYYGAMEMQSLHDDEFAPALNLGGLLQIAKWVGALNAFDKDGDYSVFANLLKHEDFKQAEQLKKAAYFERIIDLEKATKTLDTISQSLQKGLAGIGGLFREQLQQRISWYKVGKSVKKTRQVYLQQRKLAFSYLDKRDYTRAIIFAMEGLKINFLEADDDPYRFEDKGKINIQDHLSATQRKDFFLLREIRNQLAHGSYYREDYYGKAKENQKTAKQLLQNENKLRSELKRLIENLLD